MAVTVSDDGTLKYRLDEIERQMNLEIDAAKARAQEAKKAAIEEEAKNAQEAVAQKIQQFESEAGTI